MRLEELLPPDRLACHSEAHSKKRALQEISRLLSASEPALNEDEVFDALLSRERLGTTGLGRGVAIPHGRLARLERARAAMLKLDEGIDFDAVDRQPVDLIIALLVPAEATKEHLDLLARLAEMLADERFVTRLRGARNCQALHDLIASWQPPTAA